MRLGSTKQVVDSSQAVENSYSYEAFGQPTVGQSEVANPYLFVGGYGVQWENTPRLYSMQARYYGPGVGRFLSEDPYGGAPQDPLSLHRYLYCGNGPVSRIDPRGRRPFGSDPSDSFDLETGEIPEGDYWSKDYLDRYEELQRELRREWVRTEAVDLAVCVVGCLLLHWWNAEIGAWSCVAICLPALGSCSLLYWNLTH